MKTQSRERGPSYPRHMPEGMFEAISWMPHRQRYCRTRHHTLVKAVKRLEGNPLHEHKRVVDHTPQAKAKA